MKFGKRNIRRIFCLAGFVVLLLIIGAITIKAFNNLTIKFTGQQLQVYSNVVAVVFRKQLDKQLSNLDFVAYSMKENSSVWKKILKTDFAKTGSSGIIYKNQTFIDAEDFTPAKYSGISESFDGKRAVSFAKDEGILFTVPFYEGNEVSAVIYHFIRMDSLDRIFNFEFYEGKDQIAVADFNRNLIYSGNSTQVSSVFDHPLVKERVERLAAGEIKSITDTLMVQFNGHYSLIFTAVIPDTNFIVAGVFPYYVFAEGLNKIVVVFFIIFGILSIVFISGILFIFQEEENIKSASELEQEKKAAEKASSAKSDFLANMSHEIRTPINSILGLNEMILRECEDPAIRNYATDIYSAGHGLISIINDILDFSKIEAGRMEIIPSAYELCSLLNDVTNMISARAKSKNLEFIVDVDTRLPSRLKGDTVRLQQILVNILNNAVKYTNEGFVKLNVKQNSWDKDVINMEIEVADSGIGIKDEDKAKLFNSFQRLDLQRNRNIEGTGLGLAITGKLVAAMGGKITVQSEYGKGSVFTIVIPQQVVDFTPVGNFKDRFEKFRQSQNRSNLTYTAPNGKILIVDDNAMNLHVAKSLLKQTLVQVTLCSSGKECLEMIRKEHFDIIFLDHMMPEMDGIETLIKAKALEQSMCKGTPFIALTANAIVGVREMYLKSGFDDYISKPIEGKVFEALVRKYLPQDKVIPVDANLVRGSVKTVQPGEPEIISRKNEENKETVPEAEKSKEENTAVQEEFPVSIEKGLVYCGDDVSTYGEILQVYIEEAEENIAKLNKAIEEENYRSYTITAHAVKSTSLTVGAEGLSLKAKAQESAGKENRLDDLKNGHEEFISMYRKVVDYASHMDLKAYKQ